MSTSTSVQDRDTGSSDPAYTKLKTNDLVWYTEDVEGQLSDETRTRLETYSKIPPDQVVPHIQAVRATLWSLRAYPCTGLYVFLTPWLAHHSSLPHIIAHLQSPQTQDPKFLDVGAYIGHDLRYLHWAGIPQRSLYALDLLPFWELGYRLWKDEDVFRSTNVIGDVLDESADSEAARVCDGGMDVVYSSAVLHQFDVENGVRACKRLCRFLKTGDDGKGKRGSLLVGCITGSKGVEGLVDVGRLGKGGAGGGDGEQDVKKPVRHSVESLKRLWEGVAEELGWDVEVRVAWRTWEEYGTDPQRCAFMGSDVGVLEWEVRVL
ncbi:hypothetical protein K491DRAFT_695050 [Lophiostoma macrostomum CBS 122681]|uniref:Methyltransferase type 11 domain-containing protein n=1 Tax=Lophiostoma macrostomum CBS 122681 TaxID=1314788 RepID=A0A6A6T1R2_9PLEO|nr:hypothetical protein K491DRAFT_695050 [Lophiostoma macrostomum CBS 122681]